VSRKARLTARPFLVAAGRPTRFFDGFHRCIPAIAEAGNNLIVETHIIEFPQWRHSLAQLLQPLTSM
jgi:chloramphenicol 3-O phosphotransferase